MKSRSLWVIVIALVAGVAVGLGGSQAWRRWSAPLPGYCPICQRHEHSDSVVKLQAEGEGVIEACCLSCALSYGRQTSKVVRIVSVTDHETGKPLDPDKATFVVGGDVSSCTHSKEQMRLEDQSVPVRWDRCLPSILAFGSAESATVFQARHAGQVRTFAELKRQQP